MKYLFMFLVWAGVALGAADGFEQGISSYESGNYPAATQFFEGALKENPASGAIHYDLASAYYRQNDFGRAIFHFRESAEALPRDPDVKYNLAYARKKAVDRIEEKDNASLLSSLVAFNAREGLLALVVVATLFWISATVGLFVKRPEIRWSTRVLLVGVILTGLLVVIRQKTHQEFGVVTAVESQVYSGQGKDNVLLFTLHTGAEFSVGDNSSSEWLQIVIADGKKGWIKKSDVIF